MSKLTNEKIVALLNELEDVKVRIRAEQANCAHHFPESSRKKTYNMIKDTCSKCGYIEITEF